MIYGLDVSACQGAIRWHEVPPEFAFVIERVSIATAGLDAFRAANIQGCRDTGRIWGCYHFFMPQYDVDKQVELFWKAIGDAMPAIPLVVDLEIAAPGQSPQAIVDAARKMVDAVQAKAGRPPIIYSYPWFLRSLGDVLVCANDLGRCPLWLADYSKGERPPDTAPWAKVPLWEMPTLIQTSGNNSSHVPGIAGAVDHDIYLGDMRSFKRDLCGLPDHAHDDAVPVIHPPIDFIPPEPPEE